MGTDPIEDRLKEIERVRSIGLPGNFGYQLNWLIDQVRTLRQRVAEVEREQDTAVGGLRYAFNLLHDGDNSGAEAAICEALRAHEPTPERGREEETK